MPYIPEVPVWRPGVYQIETTDPVLGGAPNRTTKAGLANIPAQDLADRTLYLKEEMEALVKTAPVLVTVGVTGDFPTINAALMELSRAFSAYVPGGFTTTIQLLPGFVMEEQVLVSGVNLSWIDIVSVSAEVVIARDALTATLGGDSTRFPAFGGDAGAYLPRIRTLFRMNATGLASGRDGVRLNNASGCFVASGKGVQDAGACGLRAVGGSSALITGAIFSGADEDGILANYGGRIAANGVNVSGATLAGIRAGAASQVDATSVNAAGCGEGGLVALSGSLISFLNGNARRGASDSPQDIQIYQGSTIAAAGATGGTNATVNTVSAAGIIYR